MTIIDPGSGRPLKPAREAPAPPAPQFESGLAAAYKTKDRSISLGALESVDPGAAAAPPLRLGSLDGKDDVPAEAISPSIAPAPPPPPVPPPPSRTMASKPPPHVPLDTGVMPPPPPPKNEDPFAPPPSEEAMLDLGVSAAKPPPRKTPLPQPVFGVPAGASGGMPAHMSGSMAAHSSGSMSASGHRLPSAGDMHPMSQSGRGVSVGGGAGLTAYFQDRPRGRLAAGLALALLLGFLAAHVYASLAENRYAEIRRNGEYITAPTTQEDYDRAVEIRQDAIRALASARNRVAVSSGLIWLATGGAIAFVFFRYLVRSES